MGRPYRAALRCVKIFADFQASRAGKLAALRCCTPFYNALTGRPLNWVVLLHIRRYGLNCL